MRLNAIIPIFSHGKSYEESCITFSNLKFKKKFFYKFLTQNNLHIPENFRYFFNI